MNFVLIKKIIKKQFPLLFSFYQKMFWFLRLNIPTYYPQIFKKLKELSRKEGLPENGKEDEGKKVFFFAIRQDALHIAWEFTIAQALRLRGCKVDYLSCDGLVMDACNESSYPKLTQEDCDRCRKFASLFYKSASMEISWLNKFYDESWLEEGKGLISDLELSDLVTVKYDSLSIGELVRPSVCHFCRLEDIEKYGADDPRVVEIYKNFLIWAVVMINVCKKVLDHYKPEVVVMINGLFMTERMMFELTKRNGIRSVIIETGYAPDSLVVLHNQYISYGQIDGWDNYKTKELTASENQRLDDMMSDRRHGKGQAVDYWAKVKDNKQLIVDELGLAPYKSVAVLFPNITWDSATYGLEVMFKTLHDWVESTIAYFKAREDIVLVIRIHPAEATWSGAMRDSVMLWLNGKYGSELPQNVKIVPPESELSSYALMELADVGLVFSSTTGMEMSLMGKRVIVVGKTHYWGRGFTFEPSTESEYYDMMSDFLLRGLGNEKYKVDIEMARRYTNFIFYVASLQLKQVTANNFRTVPSLWLDSYKDLEPGKDRAIDTICDGIIDGKQFVL